MDARERLRLYLEQRRELGESELVLDHLPVEDVLALLGASATTAPARSARRAPKASSGTASDERPATAATVRPAESDVAGAADAPAAAPAPSPPPPPAARFDPNATDRDWRAQLRAVDAAPASTPGAPATGAPPVGAPAVGTPRSDAAPPSEAPDAPPAAPAPGGTSAPPAVPAWLTALDVPLGLSVGHALAEPAAGSTLADVERAVAGCAACALGGTALNHVPGEGNPAADFVCVGEAPGQTEDETGRPFVGAAGQLLTKILGAIKFSREDVFICNVLKHRPPGNRTPTPDEVRACRPFLEQQLALLRPRVILALGTSAAHALLETTQSLGSLRGRVHRYHGIPVVVTYHPAALLRNEAWKRPTWEDVQLARRIHDAARVASGS